MSVSPTDVYVFFAQAVNTVNEGDDGSICVNITGELERQVSVTVSYVNGSALSEYSVYNVPIIFTSLLFYQQTMELTTTSPAPLC